MADGPSIEYFPPSFPRGETRDMTLNRVIREAHLDERPEPIEGDPTTVSGGNRRIARRVALVAVLAAIAGALVGLVLAYGPDPFGDSSTEGIVGHMVIMGLAFALIGALISTLILLEREDGRMEHAVEEFAHTHPGG